jgi:hypothetical protein
MIVHCCLDVRGALKMTKRQLSGMFRDGDGRRLSADETRAVLLDHIAVGHEVIPCGPICPGFDYKTGCPGHESETQA